MDADEIVARKTNNEINEQIQKDAIKMKSDNTIRILLLGSGDSGKTTFLKQMKLLYGEPFTSIEVAAYGFEVQKNVYDSIGLIIDAFEPKLQKFSQSVDPKHVIQLLTNI